MIFRIDYKDQEIKKKIIKLFLYKKSFFIKKYKRDKMELSAFILNIECKQNFFKSASFFMKILRN